MRCSRWLMVLVVGLLFASPARSQDFLDGLDLGGFDGGMGGDPVTFAAEFTPATADRPAVLMLTATIEPGWHVYSLTQPKGGPLAAVLKLSESKDYKPIGDWRAFPEPHTRTDPKTWPGLKLEEHDNKVTWYLPIEFAAGVDVATAKVTGTASIQACKDSCMPIDVDFVAKQGKGVEIGPIEVAKPTNVQTQAPKPTTPAAPTVPEAPSEAGVYHAEGSVVTWYGWLDRSSIKPGERVNLYLRAELPEHWHVNAYEKSQTSKGNLPTLIAPKPADGFVFFQPERRGELIEKPSPVAGFGLMRYHEDKAAWVVPIDAVTELKPGEYKLAGFIGYQACEANEQGLGSCELAKGAQFSTTIKVGDTSSDTPGTVSFEPSTYNNALEASKLIADKLQVASPGSDNLRIIEFGSSDVQRKLGLIGMLGAALVGGLILNLMPCVLPVIGLKVMSFARQGGESRFRVFSLNLVYVAGVMAVFLLLATLASLTQLGLSTGDYGWGELNTLTWFKVAMTALVFVMALSFLGVWEIPLPGFAGSSAAAQIASREGYGGAFFKGMLTTILATPCSGPFLGPVFGFTIGQPLGITYLIFFCVGLGMSLPYLLIGAFPSLVQWIPKPGMWMDTFKQFMAFVLLGTVVYLLSTISEQYFIPTMALLVALWFACWLGGRLSITASAGSKWGSWLSGLAVAALVGFVGFGPESKHELPWKPFDDTQFAESRESGNVVMLEFTANWCLTCQVNLRNALDVASVKEVVRENNVHALKADWTDRDPNIKDILLKLRSRSIPLLAIYPAGRPDEVIVLRDVVTETQVLQALAAAGAVEGNPHRDFALKQLEAPAQASRTLAEVR
ncbi:cytochrome c biogenesis protein CcdA [Aeoliella sp. SH292]|uniref:protein-disulfide reductase DsbD family protein n=1 Tax=Aeoliella sp. SH292 TaxID=3454464 RepID=UPI003F9722DF